MVRLRHARTVLVAGLVTSAGQTGISTSAQAQEIPPEVSGSIEVSLDFSLDEFDGDSERDLSSFVFLETFWIFSDRISAYFSAGWGLTHAENGRFIDAGDGPEVDEAYLSFGFDSAVLDVGQVYPSFESDFGIADSAIDSGFRSDYTPALSTGAILYTYFDAFGGSQTVAFNVFAEDLSAPLSYSIQFKGEFDSADVTFAFLDSQLEDPDIPRQRAFLTSYGYTWDFAEDDDAVHSLRLVSEVVYGRGIAEIDSDALYSTIGIGFAYDNLVLNAAFSERDFISFDEKERYLSASAEYDLGRGFSVGGQISRTSGEGFVDRSLGLFLSYYLEF